MAISLSRSRSTIIIVVCVAVLVIVAGVAGYFFKEYSDLKNDPQAASQQTNKRLIEKVSKLYAVPTDEQPTVAEVKDKAKLKDQAYFANAQNGDYVLIYKKAKVALLYREKENRLINVGPVDISSEKEAGVQP